MYKGVEYINGYPACHLDWKLCDVEECKHWISSLEFGNCACRANRQMTLEEVGIALGITRERVRQIEKRAKGKLRKLIISRKSYCEMFRVLMTGPGGGEM